MVDAAMILYVPHGLEADEALAESAKRFSNI